MRKTFDDRSTVNNFASTGPENSIKFSLNTLTFKAKFRIIQNQFVWTIESIMENSPLRRTSYLCTDLPFTEIHQLFKKKNIVIVVDCSWHPVTVTATNVQVRRKMYRKWIVVLHFPRAANAILTLQTANAICRSRNEVLNEFAGEQ